MEEKIIFVNKDHSICLGKFTGAEAGFFRHHPPGKVSDAALILHHGDTGTRSFLRYEMTGEIMHPAGTYVWSGARGEGVAMRLWQAAIRREHPKRVEVRTVTKGGRALVCAVAKLYPKIEFEILV